MILYLYAFFSLATCSLVRILKQSTRATAPAPVTLSPSGPVPVPFPSLSEILYTLTYGPRYRYDPLNQAL